MREMNLGVSLKKVFVLYERLLRVIVLWSSRQRRRNEMKRNETVRY